MYLLMKRFYALLLLLTSLGSMGCCCAFIIYAIRGIAFCHVRPSTIRTVPDYFFSLRKNTERISTKFAGVNHYHEQIFF